MRMSTFSKLANAARGLERLRRNQDILERDEFDIGYRILIAKVGRHDGG